MLNTLTIGHVIVMWPDVCAPIRMKLQRSNIIYSGILEVNQLLLAQFDQAWLDNCDNKTV